MSDANPAHPGSPLPIAFTLHNADHEPVFNTLGDAQTYELKITNTSRRTLKIKRNVSKTFSLGFAAGLLVSPEKIKIAKGETGWKLGAKISKESNKIFLTFSLTRGRNLKPGQFVSVKLSGIKARGTDHSHGTMVALRYKGIDPTGADGLLKGFVSHHMSVLHTFPSELWRLDQQSRSMIDLEGRRSPERLEGAIARLHDDITPPLILDGGGLVGPGTTTLHLTLRANPKVFGHLAPADRKPVVIGSSGVLALHTVDQDLAFEGHLKVGKPKQGWVAVPSAQDKGREVQAAPREDYELTVGKDALHVSVELSASGPPRRSRISLRCEGVSMHKIEHEAFDLSVPLLVGPITGEGETLAVHGDIAMTQGGVIETSGAKHPVRIFSENGMNVAIPEDDSVAFRVGKSSARRASHLTDFVVNCTGAVFGAFSKMWRRSTIVKLRAAEDVRVGIELQQGDEETGFSVDLNNRSKFDVKRGLSVRQLGSAHEDPALFVQETTNNVGIGRDDPEAELHVEGRIMDQTGHVMPPGAIVMWSGSASQNMPKGWILCDGVTRTVDQHGNVRGAPGYPRGDGSHTITPPDLRDRFIVGAGNSYTTNQKSGKWPPGRNDTTMTLQENHVPAHQHTGFIGKKVNGKIQQRNFVSNLLYEWHTHSGNYHYHTKITDLKIDVLTDVPITINKGPDNSKRTSFDIRPHYYALCFIMKL